MGAGQVCIEKGPGLSQQQLDSAQRARAPARQPQHLADVVVSVSLQLNGDAAAQPGAQALASVPLELDVDAALRQALGAKALGHLVAQRGAHGPAHQEVHAVRS